MKKNLFILIFGWLIFMSFSCKRVYDNPYDSETSPELWAPENIDLVVDNNKATLIWNQNELRIDGFIIQNENYPNSPPVVIGKDITTYIDSSNFISQNCGLNFLYSMKAFAGDNYSTLKTYSKCSNTFVTTISISNIQSSSSTCQGYLYSISNQVSEKGFCWSVSPNPTIYNNKINLGSSSGSFSSQIDNLQQNTTYYIRAFASSSNEVFYGRELAFTTQEITVPSVSTSNVLNVTASGAECGGNLNNDGNSSQTIKGVCWSTSSDPTYSLNNSTNEGVGTGTFSSTISNLNSSTKYYLRAYAQNELGTVYGDEKSFTTLSAPPPTGPCYISTVNSSNTPHNLSLIPSGNIFNFGDDVTVNFNGSVGQSSILLYDNETNIMTLCGACIFSSVASGNYQRTVTLPSNGAISPSNCYTIRVLGTAGGSNAYLNVSDPFTIY